MLVTDKTDPDWEPIMKQAAAIITNRVAAPAMPPVAAKAGRAAVVGTEHGTAVLRDGQLVTVSCAEGETGLVYDGELPFTVERVPLERPPPTTTRVMLNVGDPEEAFTLSFLPNDSRPGPEEFIISNFIKVYPLALLDREHLDDPVLKPTLTA